MSLKKIAFVLVVLFLVACGDDDSSNPVEGCLVSSSAQLSSSSGKEDLSSGSVTSAAPCKTDSTDNCVYGTLTDERDGQVYKTVKIEDQWWMAENLNFEIEKSSCYEDKTENCEMYGRLYTWNEAKRACPSGWHLPDSTEWNVLFSSVGGISVSAKMLKSSSGWNRNCTKSTKEWENWQYGCNGADAYGFSVYPAGSKNKSSMYQWIGGLTGFWSSVEIDSTQAYYEDIDYQEDEAEIAEHDKDYGFSVRCIKDED